MLAEVANIPSPHSAQELELLVAASRGVAEFARLSRSEQDDLLHLLEGYECLAQVVRLLEWLIAHGQGTEQEIFSDFLWLMRVQYHGMEDFDAYADVAGRCVQTLNLSFSIVRLHVVEEILGVDNFHEHAKLYARLLPFVSNRRQKVLMMERLALIYEKKLFLEADVDSAYQKLLELDPQNLKALRFYKFFYVQTNMWPEAVAQLEKLIQATTNPFEKQRAAHEMAQIHLYNLNNAKRAREILEEYCSNSQLDIHQTLMEVLERLEAYDDLLELLSRVADSAASPVEKASIKLRMSLVSLKSKNFKSAIAAARECIELQPQSLLAQEALISAVVEDAQPAEVIRALEGLGKVVSQDSSRADVARLIERASNVLHR
jgi:tetratricopeptide (TPR) repeat protein